MNGTKLSITVSRPQKDWLETEATRLGISIADLIRRIIDAYRDQRGGDERS